MHYSASRGKNLYSSVKFFPAGEFLR